VTAQPPAERPRHGDVGYVSLWVPDVDRAAAFFASVLGWRYGPASGPNSRHVDGHDLHHGLWGGEERSTLFCCFAVADVADAVDRVRTAGGTAGEPHAEPYGTVADCVDDQDVRFAVFEPPGDAGEDAVVPANGRRHGDVAYLTMEVVDAAKARAFYGDVLVWRFAAGRVTDGWQVLDVVPMIGLSGGHDVATTWRRRGRCTESTTSPPRLLWSVRPAAPRRTPQHSRTA
jgi:predicted enzyme related to lactoylglutathione lyase